MDNLEIIFLVSFFSFVGFTILWRISQWPALGIDEAFHTALTLGMINKISFINIVRGLHCGLPIYHSPLNCYNLTPSLLLFGPSLWSIRVPIAIFMISAGLFSYMFSREFFDKKTALYSILALTSAPAFIFMEE